MATKSVKLCNEHCHCIPAPNNHLKCCNCEHKKERKVLFGLGGL